jgi:hypothetical protein
MTLVVCLSHFSFSFLCILLILRSDTTSQLLASLATRIEQARSSDEQKARQKTIQDDNVRSILMQIANAPPGSGGGLGGFGGNGMSKSNYDRMGSDRIMGEMEMDDDAGSGRKKK